MPALDCQALDDPADWWKNGRKEEIEDEEFS